MARRRDYLREYEQRLRRGSARGLTPAQSRGHPGVGQPLASRVARDVTILGPEGPVDVRVVGVAELTQASRYGNDVDALQNGQLDPRVYDRRWARRVIGGVGLPDARTVMALSAVGAASFDSFYPPTTAPAR
jgi:hypothetical protein